MSTTTTTPTAVSAPKSTLVQPGVTLYRFGDPLTTGAVVSPVDDTTLTLCNDPLPFELTKEEGKTVCSFKLSQQDRAYGLGQSVGSLNKRGRYVISFANQAIPHLPDVPGLNGAYPFLFLDRTKTFGMFVDFPSEVRFDIGHNDPEQLHVEIAGEDFDLYLFEADSVRELLAAYMHLIGRPFLPPAWAFGYHQCRYSYETAERVREIAQEFRSRDLPCDAIYLDIDYMDDYKVFTVSPERFEEFEGLVSDMKEQGFQLVPIIDPGVRVEAGYPVHDDGCTGNVFCKTESGEVFEGRVWPGRTYFPDFFRPEVRTWWGKWFENFTKLGVNAFWNDMNEPEIFYTPEGFDQIKDLVESADELSFRDRDSIDFKDKLTEYWQNKDYYNQFYHEVEPGRPVPHRTVHNLYSVRMLEAASEGLTTLEPELRHLLISRSSSPGLHRVAGVWTGDNHSWWEHLLLTIRTVVGLNLCGMYYCGSDVGGHCGEPTRELMIRWMQLGVCIPLYRNHTVKESRDQEPWAFGREAETIMRNMLKLRYALFPYIYSQYRTSIESGFPFVTPLFMHCDDRRSTEIDDQFFCGQSLMVAPVITENTQGRTVYLPDGLWLEWRATSAEPTALTVRCGGDHYCQAGLEALPLYLKADELVLLAPPGQTIAEQPITELAVIGLVTDSATISYFDDDGVSKGYQHGKEARLTITVTRTASGLTVDCQTQAHSEWPLRVNRLNLTIVDAHGNQERLQHSI